MQPHPDKLVELDALRGIAAMMVFVGHFCYGIAPSSVPHLAGTPFYVVLNGPAAVIVFFVLSGFVLTLRPLRRARFAPLGALLLKRWPRLAGPVVVAGLAYALAGLLGLYPRPDHLAAAVAHPPPYLFWGQAQQNEHVGEVLHEAVLGTFLDGTAQHNAALWTMHWELLGSFLAAGLAALLLLPVPRTIRVALFAAAWLGAGLYSPWLLPFPLGVAGAALHDARNTRPRIPGALAIAMVLGGAVLLAWNVNDTHGIWAWTTRFAWSRHPWTWFGTQSLGAAAWMAVALYNPTARSWLAGRLGALAGRLSFPFYLTHLLVLTSFTCWAYIAAVPGGATPWSTAALFVATLGVTVVLATPLMWFDQWWIRVLGRAAAAVWPATRRPSAAAAGAQALPSAKR